MMPWPLVKEAHSCSRQFRFLCNILSRGACIRVFGNGFYGDYKTQKVPTASVRDAKSTGRVIVFHILFLFLFLPCNFHICGKLRGRRRVTANTAIKVLNMPTIWAFFNLAVECKRSSLDLLGGWSYLYIGNQLFDLSLEIAYA